MVFAIYLLCLIGCLTVQCIPAQPAASNPAEVKQTDSTIDTSSRQRTLSDFGAEILLPDNDFQSAADEKKRGLLPTSKSLQRLRSKVTASAKRWPRTASALKKTKSAIVQNVVEFGFTYFQQKSEVLKALNIPAAQVLEFTQQLVSDYGLPSQASFLLGIAYSSDFSWDQVNFLYLPPGEVFYRAVSLLKTGDSTTNTASFILISVDIGFALVPNLLFVTTTDSQLGGICGSTDEYIQEVPRTLTFDEVLLFQNFFNLLTGNILAQSLGLTIPFPSLT